MQTNEILRSLGYEVVDYIGQGSFGEVKLATSQRHSKQVAIKIMHRTQDSYCFLSKLLPRELAILKMVKHPHIVEVHEILEMPTGQVFIVMEAAATDLEQKIVELHHIPIDKAKVWFSQLVSAVVYLHQQDIVHRDLKCSNVLLTADEKIKLTDFGFGRFSKGFPELSETFYCTRQYGAPEVLLGKPYDPKKSDVWSLGVILYSMINGSLPFKTKSLNSLIRVQRDPLMFSREIKVDMPSRFFISYMMQFNPATRPSVTEVAQHPWLQSRRERVIGRFVVVPVEEQDEGSSSHQDVNPLKTTEEESQSSSSFNSEVACTPSPTSEDWLACLSREVEEPSSQGVRGESLSPEQDDNGSRACASPTCQSVEAVEEQCGCFSCSPCCAAVKKAANAYVVAPILRASRSLQGRIRKLFRVKSVVHDSTSAPQEGNLHTAASTEAPACLCSEQRHKDVPLCGLVGEAEPVLPQPNVKQVTRRLRFPKLKILKKKKAIHPL